MKLMTHNPKVMGKLTLISRKLRIAGWIATGVMLVAVIAMLVTL